MACSKFHSALSRYRAIFSVSNAMVSPRPLPAASTSASRHAYFRSDPASGTPGRSGYDCNPATMVGILRPCTVPLVFGTEGLFGDQLEQVLARRGRPSDCPRWDRVLGPEGPKSRMVQREG